MKKVWILALLAAVSVLYFIGKPIQNQVASPEFKVAILVDATNKHLNSVVQSYLKRELHSLKDVEIVPPGKMMWQHVILVRIVEGLTESGKKNGYSCLSIGIYGKIPESHFNDRWREFHKKNPALDLLSATGQVGIQPTDKLDKYIKEFIAKTDEKYFKRLR